MFALDLVTQTARDAGGLIRIEFERPGGPRGPRGNCPVDESAEALIRDRLRGAFSGWQFFGEETGSTGEPLGASLARRPSWRDLCLPARHRGTLLGVD